EVDNSPKPEATPAPMSEKTPAPPADQGAQGSRGGTQRTVGIIVGGVGVVGVVVGSLFGLKAKSKNDQSKDDCKPSAPNDCSAAGVNLRNQALDAAKVANVGLIVGGVALATGVVLFFTAPSGKSESAGGTSLRIAGGADGSARVMFGGAF